jgi:hypothetical protein
MTVQQPLLSSRTSKDQAARDHKPVCTCRQFFVSSFSCTIYIILRSARTLFPWPECHIIAMWRPHSGSAYPHRQQDFWRQNFHFGKRSFITECENVVLLTAKKCTWNWAVYIVAGWGGGLRRISRASVGPVQMKGFQLLRNLTTGCSQFHMLFTIDHTVCFWSWSV